MTKIVLNGAVIAAFETNTSGPLARLLEAKADLVVADAKQTIGRQAPSFVNLSGSWRNPAPGPPKRRTGDLQNSLRALPARVGATGLEVLCVAPAYHRGFAYGSHLIQQKYRFNDSLALIA